MSDKQALEAVLHGETLDQTTIKRAAKHCWSGS
jgi:hypothetical protein